MKKISQTLKYNLWTLVGFEALYKIITTLIFMPLFLKGFKLITYLTGYSYLTFENITSFLLNPLTLILLIILLFLMMLYTVIDIATIIVIIDASIQKKKIKIMDAFRYALAKCKNMWHLKNIPIIFLVLFLIPFLHLGISSNLITTIKIPEFISDFIYKNPLLLSLFIVLVFILMLIFLRWLYVLHYMILENKSFKEAKKKSIKLSKSNHLKDLLSIIVTELLMSLVYGIYLLIGILLIGLFGKLFASVIIVKSIITTIIWIFIALSFIVCVLLATPISYAIISISYYKHKEEIGEKINYLLVKENKKQNILLKRTIIVLSVIALVMGSIFTYGLIKGKYNFNIEYIRTLEVTAHRGASVEYPENTMRAFREAKKLQADWIELDVQESLDGQVFVMHDTNFKRTTGLDKNTWELTYEEIAKLDAGSFLSPKFKGEKIPLLEEVVKFAKENNIKLNIEIKPTGQEKNLEKRVVEIIKENNFTDSAVVTSQVYDVIEKVKEYDSSLKTVYVMSLAYGDITSLDKADAFSIEASSVNKKLVQKVHNAGKELYAWTVNTKDNIKKMIDLKVDNIITDDIPLAKDTIYESKTSNIINEYVRLINNLFN